MSLNQQFTQAKSEMALCSLKAAVFWVLFINTLAISTAVFLTTDLTQALRSATFHAFWLNPCLLATLWGLCTFKRRQLARSLQTHPEPELEEAKLRSLSAEIRPHFFFNALNAVTGLIRVDPRQAENMLLDTAELFRAVMHQHDHRLITLALELETCEQYVRIEQARLGDRLRLDWQVDRGLTGVSVPPFCLQPLVENAIRHGVEAFSKGGSVTVVVERLEQTLLLRVRNAVLGGHADYLANASHHQNKPHNGIALDNISKRLQLMYADAAQFEYGVVNGYFEAQVVLPLEFAA